MHFFKKEENLSLYIKCILPIFREVAGAHNKNRLLTHWAIIWKSIGNVISFKVFRENLKKNREKQDWKRKLIKLIGNELSFHFWLILHYGLSYSDKQSQHCFTIKKFNVRHEGDDDERQEMTSDSEVDEFAMVWKKFKHSDRFFFGNYDELKI